MLQHNFWFISLLSLHDYDRNFQCIHMKVNFSFCFFNSTPREFAYFCQSERVGIIVRNNAEVSKDEKSLFEWRFCRRRLRGIFTTIAIASAWHLIFSQRIAPDTTWYPPNCSDMCAFPSSKKPSAHKTRPSAKLFMSGAKRPYTHIYTPLRTAEI